MNPAKTALFLFTAVIISCASVSCASVQPGDDELLHVMLQGGPSAEISKLVTDNGGTVTHDLHLIDAVGAKLTRSQLATVLQSRLITHHLDDLADDVGPEPEPEKEEEACKVRGQIEMDIDESGLLWPLHNKRDESATWESLEVTWPEALGPIRNISLDGRPLDAGLFAQQLDGSVSITFPEAARPVIEQRSDLRIDFSRPAPADAQPLQSDFVIEAGFVGGCSDKSVPGYANNAGDYYYNTVAGVDALHLQGITGRGVTVAVIDSGMWEHPALVFDTRGENRIVARYDATTDTLDAEALDESGHGTHMTSIIANSSPTVRGGIPTGSYKGVAPDAGIVAVKVLDREGRAHLLDIARAVQWVVDHRERYDIKILNISLAQRPRWPYWEDPVTQVVMHAWAAGITVVAAASNEGPEVASIGSPGNLPYIITVGAVTDSWTTDTRDDDYIPDFSSRGPTPSGHVKPDIVAPGGHMTGLTHPDSQLATDDPDNLLRTGEMVSTGSSQAAALVSGMVALLLQLEPDLTPDQLKCKLTTSAEPAINADGKLAYSPFQQGYGYVTMPRAVTLGLTDCESTRDDLMANMAGHGPYYGPAISDEEGNPTLPGLEAMVSAEPSAKGMSTTRKWGVKEHVERLSGEALKPGALNRQQLDWLELYSTERAIIEGLAESAPVATGE